MTVVRSGTNATLKSVAGVAVPDIKLAREVTELRSAIRGGHEPDLLALIEGGGLKSEARLQI
jgi:hypothetical protein